MVTFSLPPALSRGIASVTGFYRQRRRLVWSLVAVAILFLIGFRPQQFVDLWLTRDQQGQILFNTGRYDQAAATFTQTRWQAYSLYGAEEFDKSATLYSQYNNTDDVLARGNALAQGRRYVKARAVYQSILDQDPGHEAAAHNLKIVQEIIDAVDLMSESQKPEAGDSPKDLGDEPQTGEGAEKQEARPPEEQEQLSAEALLLDDNLNDMWLRQVQKNPARFLSHKFFMQAEQQKSGAETPAPQRGEGE